MEIDKKEHTTGGGSSGNGVGGGNSEIEDATQRAASLMDPKFTRRQLVRLIVGYEFKERGLSLDKIMDRASARRKRYLSGGPVSSVNQDGTAAPEIIKASPSVSPSGKARCKKKQKSRGKKKSRAFDWTKCRTRNVFLKVAYVGEKYHGFVQQEDTTNPTVEGELMNALELTCLIKDRRDCGYSRCGRTDKGVSALGNVVSLHIRSRLKSGLGMVRLEQSRPKPPATSEIKEPTITAEKMEEEKVEEDAEENKKSVGGEDSRRSGLDCVYRESIAGELDYPAILNAVLPEDIKVLAWAPVALGMSARHSCYSRVYKYYLFKDDMDINKMKEACGYMVGRHDFRNFCKLDYINISRFERSLDAISVNEIGSLNTHLRLPVQVATTSSSAGEFGDGKEGTRSSDPDNLIEVTIQGNAFLWHQVRITIALLVMVGLGQESPSLVKDLLDMKKWPSKPNFKMASDVPLVLYDCLYRNVHFVYNLGVQARALSDMNWLWRKNAIKAQVCCVFQNRIFQNLIRCHPGDITEASSEEVSSKHLERERDYREFCIRGEQLKRKSKTKGKNKHIPLSQRAREKSYEERIRTLHGKKLKRQREQAEVSESYRQFHIDRELNRLKSAFVPPKNLYICTEPKEHERLKPKSGK
mmetsp:Transcript_31168/g.61027  ORF Transcript_31168/g.61027 Transcript_31168/m.61027 type:complete len:641 (+) Transcript_31168:202-2124(+)